MRPTDGLVRRIRSTVAVAVLAAGAVGFAPVTQADTAVSGTSGTQPASPAQEVLWHWAYAVALHPTTTSYQPGAANSRDDMGTTASIQRLSRGLYDVRFPNEYTTTSTYGIVVATAISTTGATCGLSDFGQSGTDELVTIACFDRMGAPADTKFSMNFFIDHVLNGAAAYLLADQPTLTTYTLQPDYSFNSTGATNTILRTAVGRYDVRLPGLDSVFGNVQVDSTGGHPCRVLSFGPDTGAELVHVACISPSGHAADAGFTLTYTRGQGLKQPGATGVAYLEADRPSIGSYTPVKAYRFASNGQKPHIYRTGVGRYKVIIPGMAGGAAEVTTYGGGNSRCNLTYLAVSGSSEKIGVNCEKPNGTPVDSTFGLSYTR